MNAIVKPKREGRTKEAWQGLRELWEANPSKSFSDIAGIAGCTKQAVSLRAQREGWTRVTDSAAINRRAVTLADQVTRSVAVQPVEDVTVGLPPASDFKSLGTAEGMRANILKRHRMEWNATRSIIYKAMRESDTNAARHARVVADALATVQAGERRAWQLDSPESSDNPNELNIVIVRE